MVVKWMFIIQCLAGKENYITTEQTLLRMLTKKINRMKNTHLLLNKPPTTNSRITQLNKINTSRQIPNINYRSRRNHFQFFD